MTVAAGTLTTTGAIAAGVLNANGTIDSISNVARIGAGGVIGSAAGFNNVIAGIVNSGSAGRIGTLSNTGTITTTATVQVTATLPTGSVQNVLAGIANMAGTISSLSNAGLISLTGTVLDEQSALGAIVNLGVIEMLTNQTNGRLIASGNAYTAAGITNAATGTIGTLLNDTGATISGPYGVLNRGLISTFINSGTIESTNSTWAVVADVGSTITLFQNTGTGVVSSGSSGVRVEGNIGTLTNAGIITSGYGGVVVGEAGSISVLNNSGTISSDNTGIIDDGSIGTINNSGTIQGSYAAIVSEGSSPLAVLNNTGVIAGTIENDRSSNLTITGGTGTVVGTLTGSSGGTGSADKGVINSTGGDLVFASGNILLNDNVTVTGHKLINSANVSLVNPITVAGTIQLAGGTFSGGTLTATTAYDMRAGSVSSVLAGSVGLAKSTTDTVTLSGANTYTGATTISAGVLAISNGAALGTTGQGTTISSGATLQLSGGISVGAEALSLSGTGATGATGALESASGTNSYAGTITLAASSTIAVDAGQLTLSGTLAASSRTLSVVGAGTLILTGTASATQTNIASGSTLQIGSGGTTGALAGAIANSGTLVVNRSNDITITGVISGSGGLTNLGSGHTYLTAANTYTGLTTVAAGTLSVGNGGTTGSIAGDVVNNATLAFSRSDDITYAGTISGTGIVTVGGGGTTTFTGESTYTGGTQISGATLQIGDGGTSGSIVGDVATAAGGVAGTLAFNRSDDVTFSGIISGTGSLSQRGTGTLILTGENTLTGGTTIRSGTLQIGNGGTTGSLAGDILNDSALVFDRSNAVTSAGVISGTGTLTKAGAGTLTLSGANTYTGATAVTAGALLISNSAALGSTASGTSVSSGATLQLSGGISVGAEALSIAGTGASGATGALENVSGANTYGGTVTLAADSTIAVDAGALTLSGTLDGGVYNLSLAGTGTLILTGTASVTQTTIASGSTLQIGNGGSTGSLAGAVLNNGALVFNRATQITASNAISGTGSLTKRGAGALYLTGANTYTGGTTVTAGTLYIGDGGTTGSIAGNVVNNSVLGFLRSDALSYAGIISGTGQVEVGGGGTTIFTGTNTYTGGTQISGATLQIGDGGTSGSIVGDVATAAGGVAGTLAFNRSDDVTFSGIISGTGSLSQRGTGTLILTGENTLTGGTTIRSGTLQIGNGGTTGSLAGDILNDSTLVFDRSDALTLDGTISGTGTLIQRGTGTLTLTGTNSAGTTNVEAGTLALANLAQLTGNVTVASGATLAGTTTSSGSALVNGVVTVADGGHLSVTPVGGGGYSLSVTELVLNNTSNLDVALGANLGTAAVYAQTLTLDGVLNVTNTGGMSFGVYRIIDYGTLAADNGLVLGTAPLTYGYDIQTSVANQINLVVNASSLFWNGSTTTPDGTIHGGTGTWVTGGATSWTNAAGTTAQSWAGAIAIFQGAPGTVTVDTSGGAVEVLAMQFAVDGYQVDGGTLTLANTSGQTQIRVGDGTSAGAAYVATVSSVLAGTTGLEKLDLGTLVLTGANTYTGGTTVTAGTLQIGDGGTTGSILGDVINNAALVFSPATDLTYGGVISGTGTFTKSGAGTLTLTGSNSYSGATTITDGRLIASGGLGLGYTSALTIAASGTLELRDADQTVGALAGAGAVALNGNCLTITGGGTTFSGAISGAGCISKTGSGTLELTGTSTYSGGTTILGGTVQVYSAAALGTGSLALIGSGTLRASDTFTYANAISLTRASGSGGGTFQVDDARTLTLSGAITGSGNLDKTGTGTLVLGGTNTYAGTTSVTAGTLVVTGGHAISDTGTVTVASDAAFVLRASETVGAISGAGTVTLDGATLTTGGSNTSTTLSGLIGGTGGLTKTGTGTLTLTAVNTYTGATTVTDGGLVVQGTVAGDVYVQDQATLSGTGTVSQTVHVLSGGTLSGAQASGLSMGNLDLASGANVDVALGATSGGGVFSVTGDLTLAGTLNVTTTAGFGVGIYRIFSYGGTLTDNDMSVSSIVGGYVGGVQSSIAGQVNLVVEDSSNPILFWNGSQTTPTQAVVGGSGTWTADTQTNWTNADGTVSHNWSNGFAVFQGTAGVITVDTSGGQVSASGLQFATDGYEITGGAIVLASTSGAAPVIRVGDGTTDGADMTATISAVLTGTAGLEKTDYGTLVLTGANTYTGGTTISAGTLQLGDGITNGSILGDVVDNGVLAFDLAADTTFAGTISGTGALTLQGAGTLALTGSNSYSGGTSISGGTLQIAQADALGTGGLTLANGGTLRASGTFTYGGSVVLSAASIVSRAAAVSGGAVEVDAAQALTLSGVISGSGALTKTGEGLLILTGNNTYTGLTTISAGTLQIGNGGTTGSIAGDVVNNATLVFNRSDTYTFTGAITGTGAVTFMGGGTVLFSAPYSGAVTVDDSVVTLVAGSSTSSAFAVNSGGVIGGTATIGGLTVNSGGTAAPGYSPGTITVTGPVTFNSGSTYLVDVTPAGEHDLIIATGAVSLSSGASVQVNATAGVYAAHSTVTILTTSSTLTGTFGSVTSNYAFLTPELSYDAQNVYLSLAYSGIDFSVYARTSNEFGTAVAAQALGSGTVFDAIVSLPQTAVAPAFDQLSGEIYASAGTLIQQEAVYLRDAVGTRLRQAATPTGADPLAYAAKAAGPATAQLSRDLTPTLWMQGYGGWGNAFGNGNAASLSSSVGGVFGGLDTSVAGGVQAGLVAGFSQTRFDVGARGSSGSMDNYDLGLYAGGQFGAFALRGGLSYTWHDISVNRTVVFPGFAGATKGGDTVGTTQLFGEVGYGVDVGAYAFEPFAGLAYVNLSGGSLAETGQLMSGAGLNVSTGSMDTVYTTLGLRAATSMMLGGHALTPNASIGWQHAFGDTTPVATMLFQGGSTPFQVSGVPVAEDALLLGAGIGYDVSDVATLQVNYTGQLAGAASQNAISAQFSLKF